MLFPDLGTGSQPSRADPVRAIPIVVEAGDRHVLAGLPRVDEASVADVDPVVPEPVEEDEIAGREAVARDRRAQLVLRRRVVRQRDADLRVDVAYEARAVELGR